jgi:hypothetical protein
MRLVFNALVAGLLVACTGLPPPPAGTCSTRDQCEIEGYARAR